MTTQQFTKFCIALLACWMLSLLAIAIAFSSEPVIIIDGKPLENVERIEITTRQEPESQSPTGREPRILWSSSWQARWEKALIENHQWTQWLQFAVLNPGSAYFDKDLFPVIMYQITGDITYANQAWEYLSIESAKPLSGDKVRANWLIWLVCYEWLHPSLDETKQKQFSDWMDRCLLFVSDTPLADSDRLVTAYFGSLIWTALSNKESLDLTDLETRLIEYSKLSEGGDWIEGTYYNTGTMTMLMIGLQACKDLNLFVPDELISFSEQLALAERHRWDNTVSHRATWGAIQTSNFPKTNLNRGDLVLDLLAALKLHDLIHGVQSKGDYWIKPHATAFLFYNPYQNSPPGELPKLLACKGQQLLYARSSWTDLNTTLVLFRCGRFNGAHHPTFDGGHFEMLRNGEFVLARPRAYSDTGTIDGLGANNSLLLGNQPINFANRQMLAAGESNGTYYLVQEHSGPWQHGNSRTAQYVNSFKRWLVWVPGESDVLIVRDVIDIDQPVDQTSDRKAYNIGRAHDRHIEYIASQGTNKPIPLVQVVFHTPIKPNDSLSWTTPGGQTVQLQTLLPAELYNVKLIDETNLYGPSVDAKELGWQIRISPVGFVNGKIELLHVIIVGEPVLVSLEDSKVRVGTQVIEFTN